MKLTKEFLAQTLDQTNLHPDATESEIRAFVEEAREYAFRSVAIMPIWIPLATEILKGSKTTIVAAIGFPLGTCSMETKVVETKWAIESGLPDIEIDMVMNVPRLKSRQYDLVLDEIRQVVDASAGHVVKVIIEVPILSPDEVVIASMLTEKAGADFVKTSTGFKHFKGWRPSTADDVRLIKTAVGERLEVKVAGGVRSLDQALAVIDAGATRIGTSSGVAIVRAFDAFDEVVQD